MSTSRRHTGECRYREIVHRDLDSGVRRKDGDIPLLCHTGERRYPGMFDQRMDSGLRGKDRTRRVSRRTGERRYPVEPRIALPIANSGAFKRQRGISFVELIMFIVIVSVAVAGVLLTLNTAVKASADPMTQKQALSVAESLLDEIALRPVTRCDPDGPDPDGPGGPAPCAIAEAIGPEGGETRYSATSPFDNANDYHGFSMSPIVDAENNAIPGLASYMATVTVTNAALPSVNAGDAVLVTVRVTGPGNNPDVSLSSARVRYAADPP